MRPAAPCPKVFRFRGVRPFVLTRRGMQKGALPVLFAVALATACASSRPASPEGTLSAYAAALRAGKAREAYDLLSADAKKDIPFASFQRILRENPDEAVAIGRALAQPAAPPRVTAVVKAPNGESLLLVLEDGAWRVD